MNGTTRILFCHTIGYLPCRYRNIDVIIAVTFAIANSVYGLFGCYFARLQLKAAGMSASWLSSHGPPPFIEKHWEVQRRHSCCNTHRHFSQYSFSSIVYNFIYDLELKACNAMSKLHREKETGCCGLIRATVRLGKLPVLHLGWDRIHW
jgi:hypothetical protein